MGKHDRRGMSPPHPLRQREERAQASRRAGGRGSAGHRDPDDDGPRRPLLIYVLLCALVVGAGAFLWRAYDDGTGGGPIRVVPQQERFKEPGPGAEEAPTPVEDQLRTAETPPIERFAEGPEEPLSPEEAAALEAPTGPPAFVNNGPFVAQIAALQSEDGIGPLWRRLADRAPDLFADARMDVQRADLGARGVYLRVRVGYFPDRENAARFCARMRAMGQDCMAVERE